MRAAVWMIYLTTLASVAGAQTYDVEASGGLEKSDRVYLAASGDSLVVSVVTRARQVRSMVVLDAATGARVRALSDGKDAPQRYLAGDTYLEKGRILATRDGKQVGRVPRTAETLVAATGSSYLLCAPKGASQLVAYSALASKRGKRLWRARLPAGRHHLRVWGAYVVTSTYADGGPGRIAMLSADKGKQLVSLRLSAALRAARPTVVLVDGPPGKPDLMLIERTPRVSLVRRRRTLVVKGAYVPRWSNPMLEDGVCWSFVRDGRTYVVYNGGKTRSMTIDLKTGKEVARIEGALTYSPQTRGYALRKGTGEVVDMLTGRSVARASDLTYAGADGLLVEVAKRQAIRIHQAGVEGSTTIPLKPYNAYCTRLPGRSALLVNTLTTSGKYYGIVEVVDGKPVWRPYEGWDATAHAHDVKAAVIDAERLYVAYARGAALHVWGGPHPEPTR